MKFSGEKENNDCLSFLLNLKCFPYVTRCEDFFQTLFGGYSWSKLPLKMLDNL